MTPESIPGLVVPDELEAELSPGYPEEPPYIEHEPFLTDVRQAA